MKSCTFAVGKQEGVTKEQLQHPLDSMQKKTLPFTKNSRATN
jgi:hypothetical protein